MNMIAHQTIRKHPYPILHLQLMKIIQIISEILFLLQTRPDGCAHVELYGEDNRAIQRALLSAYPILQIQIQPASLTAFRINMSLNKSVPFFLFPLFPVNNVTV